jgi:hypothetical protein
VNCAFQFHNSFLRQFERREDGTGYLLLHGPVHREQGDLFQAGQECGFQFVRIHFTEMHVSGPIVLDEYCLKGSVSLEGHLPDGTMYLPLDQEGPVQIALQLSPRFETTVVDGQSIRVELEGEFELEYVWEEDASQSGE